MRRQKRKQETLYGMMVITLMTALALTLMVPTWTMAATTAASNPVDTTIVGILPAVNADVANTALKNTEESNLAECMTCHPTDRLVAMSTMADEAKMVQMTKMPTMGQDITIRTAIDRLEESQVLATAMKPTDVVSGQTTSITDRTSMAYQPIYRQSLQVQRLLWYPGIYTGTSSISAQSEVTRIGTAMMTVSSPTRHIVLKMPSVISGNVAADTISGGYSLPLTG